MQIRISMTTTERSNQIGFRNTNGRRKSTRKGCKKMEIRLDLLTLFDRTKIDREKIHWIQMLTQRLCSWSAMWPMNMFRKYWSNRSYSEIWAISKGYTVRQNVCDLTVPLMVAFPRLREFLATVRPFIPRLRFFFLFLLKWKLACAH